MDHYSLKRPKRQIIFDQKDIGKRCSVVFVIKRKTLLLLSNIAVQEAHSIRMQNANKKPKTSTSVFLV